MCKEFDAAIANLNNKKIGKNKDVLYAPWKNRHSNTIEDFYKDFIEERLPDPKIVLQWHNLLMEYSERPGAIFPIRGGYSDSKDNQKLRLRRGWLIRVDKDAKYEKKFSYMFTDNHLPVYIYKMALDGFCPTPEDFFEYMTEFKHPSDIGWLQGKEIKNPLGKNGQERHFLSMPVHYGWVGKSTYPGNTETMKNAFINTSPSPSCPLGEHGYKHAHVLAVKGLYEIEQKDVEWKNIGLVQLGEESTTQQNYQWDDTIKNYVWDRKMKDANERSKLRAVVVAHFLRFCDPINHFLAPKQGANKFTRWDKEYSLDIAEYDNLISHLMFIREQQFGEVFTEFKKAALASKNTQVEDHGIEPIDIVYHEDRQSAASQHSTIQNPSSTPSRNNTNKMRKKSSATQKSIPEIILNPNDEQIFTSTLLQRKKGHFVLTYASGEVKTISWKADKFKKESNLKGNIQSKTFWRNNNKHQEGLLKVEVYID